MTKSLAGISLLIGVASVSFPVLAEQQTLRTCREEWRANQTALRANRMTQKVYVADCQAHAAKVGAASAAPASADTRKNPTAATAGPQSPSEQCWQAGSDGWTVICSTRVTSGTCGTGNANGTCIFY